MVKITPKNRARMSIKIARVAIEPSAVTMRPTLKAPITIRVTVFSSDCPLNTIGLDVILRSSFAAAIRLPLNVIPPTIMPSPAVNLSIPVRPYVEFTKESKETIAELPPPNPFRRATICGIWIIATFTDR